MGDILQQVRDKLQREFEPTHFVLEDLSGGCGTSLSVVVVSTKFDGAPATCSVCQKKKSTKLVHQAYRCWSGTEWSTLACRRS